MDNEENKTNDLDVKPEGESSAPPDANAADSSKAGTEGVKTLSDVVQDVVDRHAKDGEKTSDTPSEGEETPDSTTAKEEPGDEKTDEKNKTAELPKEGEAVPYDRFKTVITERNELKQKYEADAPFAQTAKALTQFCQANSVTQADLQGALQLLALSKTDAKAFRAKMGEMMTSMDIEAGAKLPDDLQKEVEDGTLSEVRAKELAQARVRLQMSEQQGKVQAQQQVRATQDAVVSALSEWEAAQAAKFPEWLKYSDSIQDRFNRLCQEHYPQSPQEAIKLAEQALQTVQTRFKTFIPKAPVRKPLRSTGSSTNNGQPFVLKSLDDLGTLVRDVAGRHR